MVRKKEKSSASSRLKQEDDENEDSDIEEPPLKKRNTEEETVKYEKRDTWGDLYDSNKNIIRYYENLQTGNPLSKYRNSVKLSLINYIKTFRVSKIEHAFDRRVTFIEWHPNDPTLLAVASKGGDIILWNYNDHINVAHCVKGIGAGGSVQAMKFDLTTPHRIFTVSIEGKFLVLDFITKKAEQFLDTLDYKRWYSSLDINWDTKTMVVGDNKGILTVLTTDGKVAYTTKVHKTSGKVTHVEYSKREPWLLCTTSCDKTVKLWDIRQLKTDKKSIGIPLTTISHEKPINAAYFSLTDGCRLLTTDQYDRIHIYRSPLWNLETEIAHPHRQFQHLTPIRAYWHPFEDIIFVGRYPHSKFPGYSEGEPRSIDFFDAGSGKLLHQHYEHIFNGISPLNKFNITGDTWASGSGARIIIWKPKIQMEKWSERKNDDGEDAETVRLPKLPRRNNSKTGKSKAQSSGKSKTLD